MRRAEVVNPVLLLDEIDKLGQDYRGDPASALLEVLDPEQNRNFSDHYLEVDYDLSHVLFITTANSLGTIPEPLRDRMEIIRLPGYLDIEKQAIARQFLIPKQLKQNGLDPTNITFEPSTVYEVIHRYTREAGVRELERRLARIARKLARRRAEQSATEQPATEQPATEPASASEVPVAAAGEAAVATTKKRSRSKKKAQAADAAVTEATPPPVAVAVPQTVSADDLRSLLGVPPYDPEDMSLDDKVGVATGLAYTSVGGETLEIEVAIVRGRGKVQLTGTLGDVMKESASAALSYARSRAAALGIDRDFHRSRDLHVHIPAGATPKDGPSAGIAIATAVISALTGRPVRGDTAMTGEITLRGRVLPIGGLKEKSVAAHRNGIAHVIIPFGNARELEELPDEVQTAVHFHPVRTMDDVMAFVLRGVAAPLPEIPIVAQPHGRIDSGHTLMPQETGADPLVIRDLRFLGPMATVDGWRPETTLPEVAFAGRSNVGKSSLLNRLIRRKAFARVSRTPGRTREINFFEVNARFVLVDLPGYGYARISKERRAEWRPLIEGYLRRSTNLRGVVQLIDVRRDPTDDDLQMLDFLSEIGVPDDRSRHKGGQVVDERSMRPVFTS